MSFFRKILKKISRIFIDPYTYTKRREPFQLAIETFRYRCAGLGLALTQNERRILDLKDKHLGQRAFILGNGPSLNQCDLTPLKNEYTFGVNNLYLNESRMGFVPTYYFVEDELVAQDRHREIDAYHGPTKFFGNYLRYCIKGDQNTIWLNVRMDYRDYPGFPNFSHDPARILWVGGTVTYLCMQMAYYMGFEKVYLVGFDHSYSISRSTIKLDQDGTELLSVDKDPNHFHPGYFGNGYRWHDPRLDRMEKAYHRAKIEFEKTGRVIYNATPGGKLEIFERADYAKVISQK